MLWWNGWKICVFYLLFNAKQVLLTLVFTISRMSYFSKIVRKKRRKFTFFDARHAQYDIIKHFASLCQHFCFYHLKRWKTRTFTRKWLDHLLLMTSYLVTLLRSVHTRGLVSATSLGDQVPSCERPCDQMNVFNPIFYFFAWRISLAFVCTGGLDRTVSGFRF